MDPGKLYSFFEGALEQILSAIASLSQKVKIERSTDLLVSLQILNFVLAKTYICVQCPAGTTSATTRDIERALDDLEKLCTVCSYKLHVWPRLGLTPTLVATDQSQPPTTRKVSNTMANVVWPHRRSGSIEI